MVRLLAMNPILYWSLLALTCGYALIRGRSDERLTAVVCIAASLLTPIVLSPIAERYTHIESGELLIDCAVLAAFTLVAVRSDRFWPLWLAGLQLTTSLAHFLKAVHLDLMPSAYAAAERFWSYPILIILAIGTWRGHRRRMREQKAT
jgi:hypothetical protein